jgi:disulfide bond formation protein DsbB
VSRRAGWLSLLLGAAAALAALLLQHVGGLQPCLLCVLQRYFLLGCVLASAAWVAAPVGRWRAGAAAVAGVLATGGLATAAWQIWIQASPAQVQACLPGWDALLEQLPLSQVLPLVFQGGGDCALRSELWFGVTPPQAGAGVFFAILALVGAWFVSSRQTRGR